MKLRLDRQGLQRCQILQVVSILVVANETLRQWK
jgi:hypothetical protein